MSRQMEVDGAWSLARVARAQPADPALGARVTRSTRSWHAEYQYLDIQPLAALKIVLQQTCARVADDEVGHCGGGRHSVLFSLSRRRIAAPIMNKVIRDVFPGGRERLRSRRRHDLYSGTIEQAIFETLLRTTTWRGRRKLVPLAADGAAADHRQRQDVPRSRLRRASTSPPIRRSGAEARTDRRGRRSIR